MLITKISKILQKYFWVVAGIFLVLISLSMFFYQRQSIKVKKYDYSQYIIDSNIDFEYSVENSISDENSYVNGWCIERNKTYTFYNYGWGREGSSVYNNIHLGCINGDNVYEFPTRLGRGMM